MSSLNNKIGGIDTIIGLERYGFIHNVNNVKCCVKLLAGIWCETVPFIVGGKIMTLTDSIFDDEAIFP